MQTSNEIPTRLPCKKQSVAKTSSPSKEGQFNPALNACTRNALNVDEEKKKLEMMWSISIMQIYAGMRKRAAHSKT